MEFIFALAAFAIGAGSIARGKNRNMFLWGALGLVLGPFAILIVALIKPAPGADQGYN